MNAIIGDNGIITRAQEATVLQNCANLEEYLNQEYVVGVADDKVENGESEVKLTPLEQMIRLHSDYFFKNGSYDYVIYEYTSDEGKTEYLKIRLINKEKLGEDVKNQLSIGDAKGNSRDAYLEFEDVFGVTDDLKVFYCKDGMLSAIGADFLKSSLLDSSKVMQKKDSPASKALAESTSTETRDLTVSDLWSTRELTVSNNSGAENLSFLIDMPNVEKLTLKNYGGSLSGIGNLINLTYLYIDNTDGKTNMNYEELSLANKLEKLYFLMPTDEEVKKMCEEMGKTTYENLRVLSLAGYINFKENNRYIVELATSSGSRGERSKLTTLESLALLGETKKKITTLYVNNNIITSLKGIEGFVNLQKLYLNNCRVENASQKGTWSSVQIGECIMNMKSLDTLFCPFSNIQNEDLKAISNNTNLVSLSICGNTEITELECLLDLKSLTGLAAIGIQNLVLSGSVAIKLANMQQVYLDEKYNTTLSLANPGKEVFLGADAVNTDLDILEKNKEKIEIFEIVNNKNITNEKLQDFLSKLTKLNTLIADGSSLSSFDFIKSKNTTLQIISILNTNISSLDNLDLCDNLGALRLNNSNLNLKNYSNLVSKICNHNVASYKLYKTGTRIALGGVVAPVEILNKLNGTPDAPNTELTCFSSYHGSTFPGGTIDFSYTNLSSLKTTWCCDTTIIVPAYFNTVVAADFAYTIIDYSNAVSCELYDAKDIQSKNTENFGGYSSVKTWGDPVSILGENSLKLWFGTYNAGKSDGRVTTTSQTLDLASIVKKAPNLTELNLNMVTGLSDIYVLNDLSLQTLDISNTSLFTLTTSANKTFGNIGNSLKTLRITNCVSFNGLEGLSSLKKITELDFTGDKSLSNTVNIVDKGEINTCDYIAESLPNLNKVTLKDTGITNFNGLTSKGFKETENGSRVFVKGN